MKARINPKVPTKELLLLITCTIALLGGLGNDLTAQSAHSSNMPEVLPAHANVAPLPIPPSPTPRPLPTCTAPCVPSTDALPNNPSLQYFAVWDGNLPDLFAVSEFSNLVWVNVNATILTTPKTAPGSLAASLSQIMALKKKAILFFDFGWAGQTPDPSLSTELEELVTAVGSYSNVVVAFYPLDEPFLHISDGSYLASEIAEVKAIPAFSNWKAAVVFSTCEINLTAGRPTLNDGCTTVINNGNGVEPIVSAIPTGYDWVGVDCYTVPGSPSFASFNSCDGYSIPDYLGVLASLPNSPDKFIINPTAILSDSLVNEDQPDLVNDDELYMQYAQGNLGAYPSYWNNVVAISPFQYDNGNPAGSDGLGSMPELQAEIEPWGEYISRANNYYPFKTAAATNVLANWPAGNAIDGLPWTAYSSNIFPTSANPDGATYIQAMLDTTSTPFTVQNIALTARMSNGVALGFPQSYEILTSPDNSSWISQGYFPTQPNAAGVAIIQLPEPVQTYGVVINPTILGTDNFGNYYFQLAEIGLQGPLGTAYSIPMTSAFSNNVLSGWPASNAIAGPTVCCYSSNLFPSSQNTTGAYLAAWTDPTAGPFHAQNVVLTARMLNGVPQAFPLSYEVFTTISPSTNDNSTWTSQGTFSTQPNSAGTVTIPVPQAGQIYGVKILPLALGADSFDNAYFQLAQIGLSGYY